MGQNLENGMEEGVGTFKATTALLVCWTVLVPAILTFGFHRLGLLGWG